MFYFPITLPDSAAALSQKFKAAQNTTPNPIVRQLVIALGDKKPDTN